MPSIRFLPAALGSMIAIVVPVQAQDMMTATIGSNITYDANQRMIDETRQRDAENGIRYDGNRHVRVATPSPTIPTYVLDRTRSAAMAALNPEYSRRVNAYGKVRADQWMNGAAKNVGSATGALAPEYRRRVQDDGRTKADSWYVDQARNIGQRYVADSGR